MSGPVIDPFQAEMKLFGLNVKRLRKELGISQEELGFMSALHRAYIGAVERGERNLTIQNIIKISRALAVSPSDLFIDIYAEKGLNHIYSQREFVKLLRTLERSVNSSAGVIFGKISGINLIRELNGVGKRGLFEKEAFRRIKALCMEKDIFARWGENEFVILMPYTLPEDEMIAICGRIRGISDSFRERDVCCSISLGYSIGRDAEFRFVELISSARERMYREKLLRSGEIRRLIADFLGEVLSRRDQEILSHSNRLKSAALKLGVMIGLSQREMEELALSSILHDIGMVGLPEDILFKKDILPPEELKILRRHPEIGYRLMVSSEELSGLSEAILYHHERWDGRGYPEGLKSDNIPIASRIIHIAEAFDVLTAGRRYKSKVDLQEALKEIRECAGTQFDPGLVKIFTQMISTSDL